MDTAHLDFQIYDSILTNDSCLAVFTVELMFFFFFLYVLYK